MACWSTTSTRPPSVLTRRIFLPAARASDLGPEQWQILIAVALHEDAAHAERPRFELTARGQAAVAEYVKRAGRFLPGWPPAGSS